ncbi:hypothetical protein ADIS_3239 [Lunatimonas lonarensis]|uniref:Uncharacterized protein n=1 Tax=Lunatimonas lonarensis TaxID=1232681 RepID=R7ZPS0_9BACT|nr:hypothetical protein ADIS_3239 [Lunatimonas lonarensis]
MEKKNNGMRMDTKIPPFENLLSCKKQVLKMPDKIWKKNAT